MAVQAFVQNLLLRLCFDPSNPPPPHTINTGSIDQQCSNVFDRRSFFDSGNVRETLNGASLYVGAYHRPPFYDKSTGKGVFIDFIDELAKELNFTYVVKIPEDEQSVGLPKDMYNGGNTSWAGLMGLVERNEVNVTAAFVSILPPRRQVADFSTMIGEETWVVLMRRPRATTSGDGLVAPFETDVWILVGVALVVMGPVIYVIIWVRVKLCKGDPTLTRIFPFPQCVWFVYGALMKQGSTLNPTSDSSRVLFATWWIFVTILTSFYTANLTAYLTLSRVWLPVEDVKELNSRSTHWVGYHGDALQYYIDTESRLYYLKRQIARRRAYYVDEDEKALPMVDGKGYYFLTEKEMAERLLFHDFVKLVRSPKVKSEDKRCRFIYTYRTFLSVGYGLAFPKGSELRKKFDPVILRLTEAGIHTHHRIADVPNSDPCSQRGSFTERRLLNSDLSTTYIVAAVGYAISFVFFVGEAFKRCCDTRVRPKKTKVVEVGEKAPGFLKPNLDTYLGGVANKSGYFDTERFVRTINGRDYMVLKTSDGRTRLLPVDPNDPRAQQALAEAARASPNASAPTSAPPDAPAKPQYGFQGYLT